MVRNVVHVVECHGGYPRDEKYSAEEEHSDVEEFVNHVVDVDARGPECVAREQQSHAKEVAQAERDVDVANVVEEKEEGEVGGEKATKHQAELFDLLLRLADFEWAEDLVANGGQENHDANKLDDARVGFGKVR